jgi:Sulfotransferase family
MLVSHKHKLVIFTLERTASTSIHAALSKYVDVIINEDIKSKFPLKRGNLSHLSCEIYDKAIRPFLPYDYYKIAVVREPIDRLKSFYKMCNLELQRMSKQSSYPSAYLSSCTSFENFWNYSSTSMCIHIQKHQLSVQRNMFKDCVNPDFDDVYQKLFIDRVFDFNRLDLFCSFLSNIFGELITLPELNKSPETNLKILNPILEDIKVKLKEDIEFYKSIVAAGGELIINPYQPTP